MGILTRVQKKDGGNVDKRNLVEEKRDPVEESVEESKEKKNVEAEIKSIKKSLPSIDIKTKNLGQPKTLKSSAPGSAWRTALPNEFLFNPWAFDSLNYGK